MFWWCVIVICANWSIIYLSTALQNIITVIVVIKHIPKRGVIHALSFLILFYISMATRILTFLLFIRLSAPCFFSQEGINQIPDTEILVHVMLFLGIRLNCSYYLACDQFINIFWFCFWFNASTFLAVSEMNNIVI